MYMHYAIYTYIFVVFNFTNGEGLAKNEMKSTANISTYMV